MMEYANRQIKNVRIETLDIVNQIQTNFSFFALRACPNQEKWFFLVIINQLKGSFNIVTISSEQSFVLKYWREKFTQHRKIKFSINDFLSKFQ